mmetsp:Transcript_66472/g.110534  ORF Transcript_66472/g.110534 Transcript_66472/m.110534 type:complete len:218 (+) Transcript_66472:40-693(+)
MHQVAGHDPSDDAAIARALQNDEAYGQQHGRRAPRNPLLQPRDVIMVDHDQLVSKRVTVAALVALDVVGVIVLLLQLTGGGFPTNIDDLKERWQPELLDEFWFAPLVASTAFPLLGLAGVALQWQSLLWLYCSFILCSISFRIFFVYEAAHREGLEPRGPLLLDLMLLTFCIFLQVYVFQQASTLALLISRFRMQRRVNQRRSSSRLEGQLNAQRLP